MSTARCSCVSTESSRSGARPSTELSSRSAASATWRSNDRRECENAIVEPISAPSATAKPTQATTIIFYPRETRPTSTETTCDVALGARIGRVGEDPLRGVELDQPPHARPRLLRVGRQERGHVAHPRRLLHVVGDDDDRVVALELRHEV